jgi:hypothetical protein
MDDVYRRDALLGSGQVSHVRRENVDEAMVVLYNNISTFEKVLCIITKWADWCTKVARRRQLYVRNGV